jgi:hypothetical protein
VSGHRVVTLIEIASPADKAAAALSSGLHITVLDLIPPGGMIRTAFMAPSGSGSTSSPTYRRREAQ